MAKINAGIIARLHLKNEALRAYLKKQYRRLRSAAVLLTGAGRRGKNNGGERR
ncbi:hypothetical protein JZO77_19070 [Enterococcus hulanensis]|uniref:hypothetical protein n=1 Tax=Enterococcus hulanensis TaxID=2559929 RepID=UPI001A8F6681|nr:hypothetical protein [Enterococcus hulanensis]MBO0458840.1 hypothetical protein [Enterococcus hulanensis]